MAAKSKSNTIKIIRIYDAPVKTVWDAWTDPKIAAKWWGPRGFTLTTHSKDLRVGGHWSYTMHGPDGTDYVNEVRFLEIVPNERIDFEHLEPMHYFTMAMSFEDKDGGTLLTWVMTFEEPIDPTTREFILAANQQNFDRLQACL